MDLLSRRQAVASGHPPAVGLHAPAGHSGCPGQAWPALHMGMPPSKTGPAGDTLVIPEREQALPAERGGGWRCVSRNTVPDPLTTALPPPTPGGGL